MNPFDDVDTNPFGSTSDDPFVQNPFDPVPSQTTPPPVREKRLPPLPNPQQQPKPSPSPSSPTISRLPQTPSIPTNNVPNPIKIPTQSQPTSKQLPLAPSSSNNPFDSDPLSPAPTVSTSVITSSQLIPQETSKPNVASRPIAVANAIIQPQPQPTPSIPPSTKQTPSLIPPQQATAKPPTTVIPSDLTPSSIPSSRNPPRYVTPSSDIPNSTPQLPTQQTNIIPPIVNQVQSHHTLQQQPSSSTLIGDAFSIPVVTVRRILLRQPYSIHHHRSLVDKQALLQSAVMTLDSNVVLTIVVFLRDTLLPELFLAELIKYPLAVTIYSGYLRARGTLPGLHALYRQLGRPVDESISMLVQAYKTRDPTTRSRQLEACAAHQQRCGMNFFAQQLGNQIRLLERQVPIEAHDSKVANAGDAIYQLHPRSPLPFRPLGHTLHYCLFYHPHAPKDKLSSPEGLREQFGISDKRHVLAQLEARSRLGDWNMVAAAANPKARGWFSGKGPKSPIGFEPFVECIARYGGPQELLVQYVSLIEPVERRYGCCVQHRLFDIALEALITLRDRQKAAELRYIMSTELDAETNQRLTDKLDEALSNPKMKWK